ncbi:MAN1 [Carabus blaptoides fortunei]
MASQCAHLIRKMADFVDNLSDAELRTKLAEYGFPLVPITNTTRKVMTKKLKMLIENKNKINSDSRRSLAKYSSEEESDEDARIKKDKNRRATIGTSMLPPAATKATTRKSTRKLDGASNDDAVESTSRITTETKSRRTTRIIKPVLEVDMETGSDSEPEIIEYHTPNDDIAHSTRSGTSFTADSVKPAISSSLNRSYTGTSSYLSSRSPLGQSATTDYQPKHVTSSYNSNRYSHQNSPEPTGSSADNSFEKLNQIRSRLSLSTNYDRPIFPSSMDRKTIGGLSDGEPFSDTPFLSNFSKRLSQMSSAAPQKATTDYSYKNDIIKEHDANGSSSYNRSYLSRIRNRDYPQDFKSSQEKNIFKNNIVSFTLVGIAIAFFIGISIMYMGIRTEQSAVADNSDYVIPFCEDMKSPRPSINCVLREDITHALNLVKVLLPELTKRGIIHHCTDASVKPHMTDDEIIEFVSSNYALKDPYEIQKGINNLQVMLFKNPQWSLSVIHADKWDRSSTALDNMEQILNNRHTRNLAMTILDPPLPWKCVVFNKLYTIISSLVIIGAGFGSLYLSQKGYKYYLRTQKLKNDQIYSMVEKILDILQSNASDNSDNYLAVNHIRDMLISPQDRKRLSSVWAGAVKFLQENESRIRTEVQIVAGEEFHVWRWVGSAGLNVTGSPKSKSWQGQAFETQVGSVNSLPCSPTPCLKIRGMFDERERNLYTVREAVLSKCAHRCKILHCEVDMSSGCVYLKCASQAEAAVAYQNLHGWWYDGRLVTVKYLRLERYMQRFPDSPTKGPAYLTPSTNQPLENDWTNNDE